MVLICIVRQYWKVVYRVDLSYMNLPLCFFQRGSLNLCYKKLFLNENNKAV